MSFALFENDVKTYSIQTKVLSREYLYPFENDVKTYSIQTRKVRRLFLDGLRMM